MKNLLPACAFLVLVWPPPVNTPAAAAATRGEPMIGITVPSKLAVVAPEQAGKITSMPVAEGEQVAANGVLFELNSNLEQLEVKRLRELAESDVAVRRAEIGLRQAELVLSRTRNLRDKDIASEGDLQAHDYEVEVSRLRVQQARLEQEQQRNALAQAVERLSQRTVRSPFAGTVTQRLKGEGEAVERFVPVIEVMSFDPLWIEFDCPVTERNLFAVGNELVVAPAMNPEDMRVATVLFVSPKAKAASHSFMVRAAVTNAGLDWKSGLKMVIQPGGPATTPAKPGK